ncbi:hypothetical protein PHLCEN_2v10504 [Hermanssonia centrifuga]|uniref:BOD1/SHG1 domain-containing protein n=1 Tax=Hermanssonia centrifuga TaxID=98765 RepID=A0A2R6NML7_9APHY|nr:hypothetical protein PHLCEN_2v10504 [Hermanssonia centrifuga]
MSADSDFHFCGYHLLRTCSYRFKKSGEFDRLRRELLAQFRSSEDFAPFIDRVGDVATQQLASDHKVQYLPEASMIRELLQELNRYPIVERAVTDMEKSTLSDPTFQGAIRAHVTKILHEDRAARSDPDNNLHEDDSFRSVPVNTGQTAETNGYESEDSAMLESPLSDTPKLEAIAPFP